MPRLTPKAIEAQWRGKDRWLSDGGTRGHGVLVARIMRPGVTFYFQYVNSAGKKRALPLGHYNGDGAGGVPLAQVRIRASELSLLYKSGERDLHEYMERQRERTKREDETRKDDARRSLEEARRTSVGQLLKTYVRYLDRSGAQCHNDVANIFKNHVFESSTGKELVRLKASAASINDFVKIIGAVVEQGKGRTASKLRSYLRAAYQLAIASKTDPAAPLLLQTFGIGTNPIADISALAQFNRARHRVLNANEFSHFLKRVEASAADEKKDALMLCIRLGGQRPAQLLRAKCSDVDLSVATLTLYDPKGARREPRMHILPLTDAAAEIVRQRMAAIQLTGCRFLFTTNAESALSPGTLTAMVREISVQMVDAGEAIEKLELRDIRRTAESMMAALRVRKDIRGQVQSHGLGGIQSRHYDRHDYMVDKRDALDLWGLCVDLLRENHGSESDGAARALKEIIDAIRRTEPMNNANAWRRLISERQPSRSDGDPQ